MTISRAQMNRQLYQMGGMGIGSLPVSQPMMNSSFPAMNYGTSSPMLNYGQTPLTMASGGRIGYQEGGMEMMQDPMMQEQMMQPQMQEQMMQQAPQMDLSQVDPSQIDPKKALELIIQMLIDQGIPPDQAREIAIQMIQAVAEGGMGEMSDERVEARFGGRIRYAGGGLTNIDRARDMLQSRAPNGEFLAYINPQEAGILKLMGGAGRDVNVRGVPSFFIDKVFKGIGKAVKGVTKAVKSIVKSDIGKIALAAAAIYATGGGALFGGPGFGSAGTLFGAGGALGGTTGLFGTAPLAGTMGPASAGLFGVGGSFAPFSGTLASGIGSLVGGGGSTLGGSFLGSLAGGVLGGALAGGPPQQDPGESDADYQRRVDEYKLQYQTAINNPNPQFGGGLYPNNPFYPQRQVTAMAANGGRIGYQMGGITDLVKQVTQQEFFGTPMMADGGRMNYGFGSMIKSVLGNILTKKEETTIPPISGPTMSERLNELLSSGNKRFFQNRGLSSNYNLADLSNFREENDDYTYAANGGRMQYGLGDLVRGSGIARPVSSSESGGGSSSGFGGMISRLIQQNPQMFRSAEMSSSRNNFIDENQDGIDDRQQASYGGRMRYALGAEVPTRQNQAGITELDYRKKGGFVPPIGIKEKADDIPAMLSNNEFVFTANAVRNAGDGNVNKGAERMYSLMKNLEAGGVV